MIHKQCEEKTFRCHGHKEHRDNIHDWAEKLLELALLRLSREVLHYIR